MSCICLYGRGSSVRRRRLRLRWRERNLFARAVLSSLILLLLLLSLSSCSSALPPFLSPPPPLSSAPLAVFHLLSLPFRVSLRRFLCAGWPAEEWHTNKSIVFVTLAPLIGSSNYALAYSSIAAGKSLFPFSSLALTIICVLFAGNLHLSIARCLENHLVLARQIDKR